MKSLSFILVIFGLMACKNKNADVSPISIEKVYPTNIFLAGDCGREIKLKWGIYKPKPCGFECFGDNVVYEYIKPDFYKIYASSDKANLKLLRQVDNNTDSVSIVLEKKTSYYVQIKAIYLIQNKEVSSSLIMVSSDDLPRPQDVTLSNQYATFDLQGVKYESNLYSPILDKNQNLVIHSGGDNKGNWVNWIQDINTGRQVFIWENERPSWGKISPDGKKVVMVKTEQIQGGKEAKDLFLFDIDTQKITQITNWGSQFYTFFWSPNSQSITVTYSDYQANESVLAIMDLATRNLKKITSKALNKFDSVWLLDWLKDNSIRFGETLNFSDSYNSKATLYSLNVSNGNISKIGNLENTGIWYEYSFKYNESGTKLVFTSRRSGKDAIWVKDLTTGRAYGIENNIHSSGTINGWKSDKEIVYRISTNTADKYYESTLE
jgi:Tol biopolymer transport system component